MQDAEWSMNDEGWMDQDEKKQHGLKKVQRGSHSTTGIGGGGELVQGQSAREGRAS